MIKELGADFKCDGCGKEQHSTSGGIPFEWSQIRCYHVHYSQFELYIDICDSCWPIPEKSKRSIIAKLKKLCGLT